LDRFKEIESDLETLRLRKVQRGLERFKDISRVLEGGSERLRKL